MNANDLWLGAQESIRNSRNLFSSSEILSESKFYGPATSLLILSAEEAIKGMAYAYYSVSELGEGKELRKDLIKHEMKHELGLYFYCLQHMTTNVVKFCLYLEGTADFTEDRKLLIINGYIQQYKSNFDENKFKEISIVAEWKENANRVKNECLYVGSYNGHWRNPSDTSRKTYKHQRKICSYFLETAESSILDKQLEELRAFGKELFS